MALYENTSWTDIDSNKTTVISMLCLCSQRQPANTCVLHSWFLPSWDHADIRTKTTSLSRLPYLYNDSGKKSSKLLQGNHYTYNMISSLTMRRCPGINLWNNNLASFMFPSFLSSFAYRRINNVNAWHSSSLRHFIRQPPCTYKSLNLT
jgi:hypothetical protein